MIPIVSSARALDLICRRWERQHYRPGRRRPRGTARRRPSRLPRRPDRPRGTRSSGSCRRSRRSPRRTGTSRSSWPAASTPTRTSAASSPSAPTACRWGRASWPPRRAAPRALQAGRSARAPGGHPRGQRPGIALRSAVPRAARVADVSVGARPAAPAEVRQGLRAAQGREGRYTRCLAKESNEHSFCICNGLCSSAGYDAATRSRSTRWVPPPGGWIASSPRTNSWQSSPESL